MVSALRERAGAALADVSSRVLARQGHGLARRGDAQLALRVEPLLAGLVLEVPLLEVDDLARPSLGLRDLLPRAVLGDLEVLQPVR